MLDFSIGEEATAPNLEPSTGEKELVVEDVVWLRVLGWLLPSLFDHVKKTRHVNPKIFKPKNMGLLGTTATSKEQRTMVGERRGEGLEDEVIMRDVPILIAKKSIKAAHSRGSALVGPSESSILKADLFKVTRMKGISEPVDSRAVDVEIVFVTSSTDLIEVT